MKKLRVMTVVGTRPEIIRLSAVIHKLNESEAIDHLLVHTGQNYDFELNEIFFKDFDLKKPDYFLNAATGSAMETIGKIITKIDEVLEKTKPDAFLVLGDTNSSISAIAAKRRHIPIFHMEAGNRCFDQRVPEETNRKIVDHIADINLPYSSIAREYLLYEGISSDRIIKTGSPMYEVLMNKKDEIDKSDILEKLGLEKEKYFVVSTHREENINSKNFTEIVNTLNTIAEMYQLPIILSTHPRTKKMIDAMNIKFHSNIRQISPLGFIEYNKLQIDSKLVLSDSGTISEESYILKFKAINIREAHERPEAMESTAVMMVGANLERILQAVKYLENQKTENINIIRDYEEANVSNKIVKIILSYTDYINRNIYKRY